MLQALFELLKITVKVLLTFIGIGLVLFCIIYFLMGNACESTVYQTYLSPDSKNQVVLHDYDCGATTGFATHVSIVDRGETVDGPGNTFIADSHYNASDSHPIHTNLIDIDIKWIDNKTVSVTYDTLARVFEDDKNVNGIKILYSSK